MVEYELYPQKPDLMSMSESIPAVIRMGNGRGKSRKFTQQASTPQTEGQGQLIISQSELSFVQTAPNKPHFLLLTIAQKGVDTPVTLTTDAPEYFQLATDSRPAFLPALTLTPSATGTHVHVRYASSDYGWHTGQLIIQNGYGTKTVALEGRRMGLIPVIQKQLPVVRQALALPQPRQRLFTKKLTLWVALTIILGIGYTAFINRNSFFPASHPTPATGRIKGLNKPSALPVSDVVSDKSAENKLSTAPKKGRKAKRTVLEKTDHTARSTFIPSAKKKRNSTPVQTSEVTSGVQAPENRIEVAPQEVNRKLKKRRRQRTVSDTSESELERLLNQPK